MAAKGPVAASLWMVGGWMWIAAACGDDAERPRARDEPTPPGESVVEEPEAEPGGEPPEELDLEVAEPDEEGRLQAECFAGSTEACDRLGH